MLRVMHRILYIIKSFLFNPSWSFKKVLRHILLKVIPSPKGAASIKVGGHTIVTYPSRNNWWKSMYIGYCDVEIAQNIKRYLRPSGIFIDVGGGIGYFSAIASKIMKEIGQVHCFEPNPSNYASIQKMIESNPNSNIILNKYALGVDESIHNYYIKRLSNATQVSMVKGVMDKNEGIESFEVRTQRLDRYLEEKKIDQVSLIKIDVEGFEYLVLRGAEEYFKKKINNPPIICEISPFACLHLNYTLSEFCDYMRSYGYHAYNIFHTNRPIDIRSLREMTDVIFKTG